MVTEKQKMEMNARKAQAREAQTMEMLLLRIWLGAKSVFNHRNKKQKGKVDE